MLIPDNTDNSYMIMTYLYSRKFKEVKVGQVPQNPISTNPGLMF